MPNASIRTAFARFWEHVIAKTGDAVAQAKSYTDSKVSSLVSADSVNSSISTHNTSVTAHSDIRELITALTTRLNTLADSDDVTLDQLSEIVAYIKSNKTLIESVTTDKLNVSDVIDNLTTAVSSKALSANQGVAIKNLIDALQADLDSHTHAISDISELQTALDGKAASSHAHAISDITNLQSTIDTVNDTISQKSQVQIITWGDDD